jgi:UDPglucose 6-dehydrogenase
VLGVESTAARDLLLEVYAPIDASKLLMNRASAELAKYAANTMLASRLSLMNELANIAEAVGADVLEVEKVLANDSRIGSKFLRSGAGFGGSCFPKDVLALEATAQEAGYTPRLIAPIIEVNNDQPKKFVQKIDQRLGGLSGKKIAVWGLAFNKNTDDVRESPAIKIVRELAARGAVVTVFDPAAMDSARQELGEAVTYASEMIVALDFADALCVLTEWPEFVSADWAAVKSRLKQPLVFDGKNCVPHDQLAALEFEVIGMGVWRKPSHQP